MGIEYFLRDAQSNDCIHLGKSSWPHNGEPASFQIDPIAMLYFIMKREGHQMVLVADTGNYCPSENRAEAQVTGRDYEICGWTDPLETCIQEIDKASNFHL